MEKTYNNVLDWFRREVNKSSLPEKYGIYFVHTCTHDSLNKTVSIQKLIYIGKAEDQTLRNRVANHEKLPEWKKYLKQWEELCYSCSVMSVDISRNEAAYINYHKPPVNTDYKDNFPFDTTTITSTWTLGKISAKFTVYRKD